MENFDAEDFVRKLTSGELDGKLHEEFKKLTYDQLEQVAVSMAQRLKNAASAG